MNKTTRLSALVLVLTLCMNLFVSALATTEGIPLEDLDVSAYQRLLTVSSEEEENSIIADGNSASVNISVPTEAFDVAYNVKAEAIELSPDEKKAVEDTGVYEILDAFEISFISAEDGSLLTPADGFPATLTFDVNVSGVGGDRLCVYSVFWYDESEGYVSGNIDPDSYYVNITDTDETITITAEANSASEKFVLVTEKWTDVGEQVSADGESVTLIGWLDKSIDRILFLDIYGRLVPVNTQDCPDFLILDTIWRSEANPDEILLYTWYPFNKDFFDTNAGYSEDIEAKYIKETADPADLYATVTGFVNAEGNNVVRLYDAASFDAYADVLIADLSATEFKVISVDCSEDLDWFVQIDMGDNTSKWISYENLANLSTTSSLIPEIEVPEWDETSDSVTLECGFDAMPENTVYTWQSSTNGADWVDVYSGNTPEFSITKTEDDVTALAAVYRCVAKDANGNVIETSAEQCVVSDEFSAWILDEEDGITVSLTMLNRAYAVSEKEDVINALTMLHVEGTELVSVYTGAAIADFVEFSDLAEYGYKLVDRSMGLTVAYVKNDGTLVAAAEVTLPEPETTDEPIEE